jgi:hypothetical protein
MPLRSETCHNFNTLIQTAIRFHLSDIIYIGFEINSECVRNIFASDQIGLDHLANVVKLGGYEYSQRDMRRV